MESPVSRGELYSAIDRQNAHLEKVISQGFEAVNRRLDVSNGRTGKLEDRQHTVERAVAILEDRAETASKTADDSRAVAINSKWWATAITGGLLTLVEAVKLLLGS
jgi:hypothetical protein